MEHAKPQSLSSIPILMKQLGYAGLIPFVFLSIALWILPADYHEILHQSLLLYAVIILSFMGAVYWGFAMSNSIANQALCTTISVIPAIIAWFSSFFSSVSQYMILIVSFFVLCMIDSFFARKKLIPQWYPSLRIPLTIIVIISLLMAQIALLQYKTE